MTKYTPKGKSLTNIYYAADVSSYVEMLEQQQAWLVHGLQELYRRTADNQGWPGEPLKCESNGHPLTHDLLTRLGALDQSKGDHFEENPDTMQQKLWRQKPAAQMQRQDSSDASSDGAQSPVASTRFSVSDTFGRQLPPTPPSFSPSRTQQPQPGPTAPVKSEQLENPAYAAQLSMQGVVNPIALQGPQWSNNGFSSPFDEMDLMPSDYTNMSFDDQPVYNRPLPLNCMTSTSFMDTKSDYEDFNQFLTNSAEIPSI